MKFILYILLFFLTISAVLQVNNLRTDNNIIVDDALRYMKMSYTLNNEPIVIEDFNRSMWKTTDKVESLNYEIQYFYLNTTSKVIAPWKYRILSPWLVGKLSSIFNNNSEGQSLVYVSGGNHQWGFLMLNIICIFLTVVFFFLFLCVLGFNKVYAFIGCLLLLLNPVIINFANMPLTDPLMYVFWILCFLIILITFVEKRSERSSVKIDWILFIILPISILCRETMFLIVPLYFLIRVDRSNYIKTTLYTLLLFTITFIPFFLVRYFIGFDSSYFNFEVIRFMISILTKWLSGAITELFLVFGVLWFFVFVGYKLMRGNLSKESISFINRSLLLLPFIFLQVFIGTNVARLLFIAFPIIIPISLLYIKSLLKD